MWPPEMEERKPAATDSAVEFDGVIADETFTVRDMWRLVWPCNM